MYRSMIVVVVTMRKRARATLFFGAETRIEKEMARGGSVLYCWYIVYMSK